VIKKEKKKARREGEGEQQTRVQGGSCSNFKENRISNGKYSFCAGPAFFLRDQCRSTPLSQSSFFMGSLPEEEQAGLAWLRTLWVPLHLRLLSIIARAVR